MTVTILDGGMGRELLRIGAPFRQPEWSALALMDGPDWVVQAHRNFIDAGAQVITTNSYACVPFHIGDSVFTERGHELTSLAGRLARQAAGEAVSVAGSLPPVFGSYRPDLFDGEKVGAVLDVLVDALAGSIDRWLIETTGSIAEAQAALKAVAAHRHERWVSFTLEDTLDPAGGARLRSGETISAALDSIGSEISAVLFNCSQPEVMAAAVVEAVRSVDGSAQVGVYANAFPLMPKEATANETLSEIRADLDPQSYVRFAQSWVDRGATIIGGCCGIRPDHIQALAASFAS
jgi:S-methylmethionine-dependent homocysteine/selenocysteine methylase